MNPLQTCVVVSRRDRIPYRSTILKSINFTFYFMSREETSVIGIKFTRYRGTPMTDGKTCHVCMCLP